jgi:hypothetical protein
MMAATSSDGVPDPVLPADLEREIFEFLAISSPRCIPKLVLVARRIKIW